MLFDKADRPVNFNIDEQVFIQYQESYDILRGTIVTPPTSKSNFYTIRMSNGDKMNVVPKDIYIEHTVPASGNPSVLQVFLHQHS